MTRPGWYYKEAIEYHLKRLGAQTWRCQTGQTRFKVEEQAKPTDVELSSDVYGAVLSPAAEVLQTLEQLEDNIGDDRIAEALFGHHPGGGQRSPTRVRPATRSCPNSAAPASDLGHPVGAYLSVSRSPRVNRTGAPMPGLGQTPWAGISGAGVSVGERLIGGGYYQPTGVRKPSAECRAGQRGRCATPAWLGI